MKKLLAFASAAALAALSFVAPAHADGSYYANGQMWSVQNYEGRTTYLDLDTNEGVISLIGTRGTCNGGGNSYNYMYPLLNRNGINVTLISCGGGKVNTCVKIDGAGGYECTVFRYR